MNRFAYFLMLSLVGGCFAVEPEAHSAPVKVPVAKAPSNAAEHAAVVSAATEAPSVPEAAPEAAPKNEAQKPEAQKPAAPALTPINDPVEAAAEFFKRQDTVMAITLLESLLNKQDISRDMRARALMLRAMISLNTGKTNEAVVRFNAWLEQFPDRPEASQIYLLLGQSYRDMQATYRAREAFYRTLTANIAKMSKTDSKDLSTSRMVTRAAMWEIAETEYQAANWERANQLFQRFRDQNSDSPELCATAIYRQADCSYQLGQMPGALQRYEVALSVSPFHPFAPEAWLRLMSLYGDLGKLDRQEQSLESFVWLVKNLHADQASYWQQRCAVVLLELLKGNPKKQAQFLTQVGAMESDPQWKSIFNFYSQLIERTGGNPSNFASKSGKQNDDGWTAWKAAFTKTQASLEDQTKTLIESRSAEMKSAN